VPKMQSRVELDPATWAAIERVARLPDDDVESSITAIGELLRLLSEGGIIEPEAAARAIVPHSKRLQRIWSAFNPSRFRAKLPVPLSLTLDTLARAAAISNLQAKLAMQFFVSSFGLVGPGMRSFTHNERLKVAVLFLSAETATVAQVA